MQPFTFDMFLESKAPKEVDHLSSLEKDAMVYKQGPGYKRHGRTAAKKNTKLSVFNTCRTHIGAKGCLLLLLAHDVATASSVLRQCNGGMAAVISTDATPLGIVWWQFLQQCQWRHC